MLGVHVNVVIVGIDCVTCGGKLRDHEVIGVSVAGKVSCLGVGAMTVGVFVAFPGQLLVVFRL